MHWVFPSALSGRRRFLQPVGITLPGAGSPFPPHRFPFNRCPTVICVTPTHTAIRRHERMESDRGEPESSPFEHETAPLPSPVRSARFMLLRQCRSTRPRLRETTRTVVRTLSNRSDEERGLGRAGRGRHHMLKKPNSSRTTLRPSLDHEAPPLLRSNSSTYPTPCNRPESDICRGQSHEIPGFHSVVLK